MKTYLATEFIVATVIIIFNVIYKEAAKLLKFNSSLNESSSCELSVRFPVNTHMTAREIAKLLIV